MELKKGETIMMNASLHLPAAFLHEAFSNRSGVPPDNFELYYRGKRLEGEVAMSSWGVVKDSTIEVKMRGRGGGAAGSYDNSGDNSGGNSDGGDGGDTGGGVGVVGGGGSAEQAGKAAAGTSGKAAEETAAAEAEAAAMEANRAALGQTRLLSDVMDISDVEVENFKRVAMYMKPNPRSVKRVSAIYRLSRLIVRKRCTSSKEEEQGLLLRLLVWIVLCEQWPVHIAWALQVLEDLHQRQQLREVRGGAAESPQDGPEGMCFEDFYHNHVKHYVFNLKQSHCPDTLRKRYQRTFALEHDKELFDCLIADKRFSLDVKHIGRLRNRDPTKLISYCTNLNPALTSLLGLIKSVPRSMEAEKQVKAMVDTGMVKGMVKGEIMFYPRFDATHRQSSGRSAEAADATAAEVSRAAEAKAAEAEAVAATAVEARVEDEEIPGLLPAQSKAQAAAAAEDEAEADAKAEPKARTEAGVKAEAKAEVRCTL